MIAYSSVGRVAAAVVACGVAIVTPSVARAAAGEPQVDMDLAPGSDSPPEPFVMRVTAVDEDGIDRVEFFLDGQLLGTMTSTPYDFDVPRLAEGDHELRARAFDLLDNVGTVSVFIVVGGTCEMSAECDPDDVCAGGRCTRGPGSGGGLGDPCESGGECFGGLCLSDGLEQSLCSAACDMDAQNCPSGFECVGAVGMNGGWCWPRSDEGGCTVAPGERSPLPLGVILFGITFAAATCRRRSR